MNDLDATAIRALLTELAAELHARGAQADVFVVGGAAMALAYDASRATRDVDAIFIPKQVVYDAASVVGERHGLRPDWLNDGVKGYLHGDDPNAERVFDEPGLRVDVASPRYLLAMKLYASRPGDEDDIKVLYRLCGFSRAEQGVELVEASYPGWSIPARVRFLLAELFGEQT